MHIKVYESSIMAPVKCGTRYLTHNNLKETHSISVFDLGKRFQIKGLKWMIVRNPIEGFISALHTDILHIVNTLSTPSGFDFSNEELKEEVLSLIYKYESFFNEEGHYHRNLYREMYWFWRRNHKDIKVIDLSEMNTYSKELGLYQPYDSKSYNFDWFDIWMDKESVALWVKTTFESEFQHLINHILINDIDGEMKMYNHLINRDLLPIKLF